MPINHKPTRAPERIQFARDQRKQANEFSQDVWQLVRGRRILGEKFRREHPRGPYTLDFVCLELKLVLEIDGKDHFSREGKQYDKQRDAYLRADGFEVLRINGFRVTQDPQAVRDEIESVVRRLSADGPSPPAPLPGGGRAVFRCCIAGRLSSPSLWEGRAKRGEGSALDPARNPPRPEAGRPSQREGEIKLHDLGAGRGEP